MQLKFFAGIFLMLMILTGCGNEQPQTQEKIQKVGMLTRSNIDEKQISDYTQKFNSAHGVTTAQQAKYYNNFNAMQMGLNSGKIDVIRTYGGVAAYMKGKNSKIEIKESQTVKLVDSFSCALRDEDSDLRDKFNAAINSMKADGTLDNLIDTYIKNLNPNEDPPAVAMPKIDGADTIKVAVTGDLPPLDLILADGKPAGFNTAILSEISKRIGKNIELIQVDSDARAAALISGQVDVIFWVVTPEGDSPYPENYDKPDGVTLTQSYYQDFVVDVSLGAIFAGM